MFGVALEKFNIFNWVFSLKKTSFHRKIFLTQLMIFNRENFL